MGPLSLDARGDLARRRVHGRHHLYRQRAEPDGHAIAVRAGIRMPGFFGYMGWSCVILIPLFLVITVLFLH